MELFSTILALLLLCNQVIETLSTSLPLVLSYNRVIETLSTNSALLLPCSYNSAILPYNIELFSTILVLLLPCNQVIDLALLLPYNSYFGRRSRSILAS